MASGFLTSPTATSVVKADSTWVKDGKWTQYHKDGKRKVVGTFKNGVYTGKYMSYHESGKKGLEGMYNKFQGKSSDGTKDGPWKYYSEDGKTIWRIITYKRGARTREDEFPLGHCHACGNAVKSPEHVKCPGCGTGY
jgi:antitoxin component YwqK of YwqJK toxin-antitoxin module